MINQMTVITTAILNLAAILDLQTEIQLALTHKLISMQKATFVPIFTLFPKSAQFACIDSPYCSAMIFQVRYAPGPLHK